MLVRNHRKKMKNSNIDKNTDNAFLINLTNAIASAIALRDLICIRYYYPEVFKKMINLII